MTAQALLDVRQMLERLIGFDTTSRNSNLALIEFVRDYLDRLGIASELVFDATGAKANLLATIGPPERAGLVLSGHTDVVPVDGQAWSSDAVRLRRARRPPVRARHRRHEGLHRDRAGAGAGASRRCGSRRRSTWRSPTTRRSAARACRACSIISARPLPAPPLGCVVGEPTGMRVANGHKGKAGYVCSVTGLASHSALNHLGVNAIEIAAAIITELRRLNDEFRADGSVRATASSRPIARSAPASSPAAARSTSCPTHCRFEFEFRPLPGQDPDALFARIRGWAERDAAAGHARRVARRRHRMAGADELSRARRRGSAPASRRCAAGSTGTRAPIKLAFGTEAGHFAARGIPTVVCGPGDIRVAHKPDEYVELAQLERCARFLRQLVHATVAA